MTEELPRLFSEDLLQELSKSKTPLKFLSPQIHDSFKYLGPSITEEDSKLTSNLSLLFVDFFVYMKCKLSLSLSQCSVMLDIMLQLIHYSIRTSQFSKDSDIEYLQSLALPFSQGMSPLFSAASMTQVLDHLSLTYFNHYNLYRFLFSNERAQENIVTLLDIDLPLPLPAHSTGVQRVVKKEGRPLEVVAENREAESLVVKESLKERLLKNMDEGVREKFLEKIAEAREVMAKQIEQRDKMLKQKWEDLEKELKRKRRRN